MADTRSDWTGGCLCGQVRYEAAGEPLNIIVCHCRICQRVMGQPFNARLLFRRDAVTVAGEVRRHPSSEALDRGFCGTCGATLFSLRHKPELIGITIGTLDDPQGATPTHHIWASSKLPWVCIEDGVEVHDGFPPRT